MRASARGEDTRQAILDAAEQIFAERGYVGASIRDICGRAEVNSGLVAYYFKNKDALFEQVIDRRQDELLSLFDREMATIDMNTPGAECARRILIGYAGFLLRLAADDTWCFYVRLLAKAAAAYDEELVGRLLTRFEPIPNLTFVMLCRALPGQDVSEIKKGLFYLEAALSTIMASSHLLKRRLELDARRAHEQLVEDIARFFANGL